MRRKGNGISAAYFADITRQTRIEERDYQIKDVDELPCVGSLIVVNEVVQEGIYVNRRNFRACVYVQQLTRNGLYVCKELYSESIQHTTCLKRSDFQRGILRFTVVEEPLFKNEHTWDEYDIRILSTACNS